MLNKLQYQVLCYPETISHATIPSWAYRDANPMTHNHTIIITQEDVQRPALTQNINKKHTLIQTAQYGVA
jgi:hypothetical protein